MEKHDTAHPAQRALSREQSKVRAIAVYKMLSEGKALTRADIARRLETRYGIKASRKTIYDDIRAVDRIMPIEMIDDGKGGYKKMEV